MYNLYYSQAQGSSQGNPLTNNTIHVNMQEQATNHYKFASGTAILVSVMWSLKTYCTRLDQCDTTQSSANKR